MVSEVEPPVNRNTLVAKLQGVFRHLDSFKGWFLTAVMLLPLLGTPYLYLYVHGIHILSDGFESPDHFDFAGNGGIAAIMLEVVFWASETVILRRLRTLTEDMRARNFRAVVYLNSVFTDWLTTPFITALVLFFLSFLNFNLGNSIKINVQNLSLGTVIAISCIFAFYSESTVALLRKLRDLFDNDNKAPDMSSPCLTCGNYKPKK